MRRIAHISDLHFGRHDLRKVEALLKSLEENRPDLVAISGDLTQRARGMEFAEARHFLDRITAPVLVVPGNHDIPLYDVRRRAFAPLAKYNRYISPAGLPECFFTDDEVAVLGVDTARRLTWKSGRVSLDQIARIRRTFDAVPRRVWKILVMHHPIASAAGEPDVELAGRSPLALRAVAEAGVDILLSGHHHRAHSGAVGAELVLNSSVLAVHAGTAVSTRTRGQENSYNLIELGPDEVAAKILQWSPAHGFVAAEGAPPIFRSAR